MTLKQTGALVPALILLGLSAAAQTQETFKGRLSLVPIDATMRAEITGTGSASAVLAGMKLSISGTFVGLHTPATSARLGQGPVTGVTGAVIADLTVSK